MWDTYEVWGGGQWQLILISVGIMVCCAYSFSISTVEDLEALKIMYVARYAFGIIFILVGGSIAIATVAAAMAVRVSDHIAIYTISENVLNFTIIILIPFAIMTVMTMCTYSNLYYKIYNRDIVFPLENSDFFNWMSKEEAGH